MGDGGTALYHFRVDENFTGAPGSGVDIYSGRGGADCSYHFRQGVRYLVFAYRSSPESAPYAYSCSDTRSIEQARGLLPQLRAMRDGTKVASLYGRLMRVQQPYSGTWADSFDQPITNTVLRAEFGHNVFKTKTDANGVYAFYDLPAGTYRMTAVLPRGLEIAQTILSDPVPPLKLPANTCYEYDVDALPTGRIRGQVLGADGTPLHSASVELFRADNYKEGAPGWWESQSDRKSNFEFLHVSPGDYLLVFNNPNRLDPDSPFPRTFYSSATESSHAQVIHLADGEQLLTANIHVSGGRPTRSLIVRLMWEEGSPSDKDLVSVSVKGSEGDTPFPREVKPRVYEITLLRDARYTVQGNQYCQRDCDENGCKPAKLWKTPAVEVDGADNRAMEVTLTFPLNTCSP